LHRDLKPTNILLQWSDSSNSAGRGGTHRGNGIPRALLSDFGTSAPFGEAPAGAASARGYTGTVEYTAPELLQVGEREYTEKSDMWSLGIVLYAMCFSCLPFSHDDPKVLKAQIRRFVEERDAAQGSDSSNSSRSSVASGVPTANAEGGAGGGSNGADAWLPPDDEGRLGPLRLVLAALLALDAARRPSATDLLENPTFRGQAARYTRRAPDPHAALPDS